MAKGDGGGLRQMINQNPAIIIGLVVVVVGAALFFGMRGPSGPPSRQKWFTVDNGASTFMDDADKLPPFNHGGQEAVEAVMVSCDGGATKKVGYLFRYTEAGKAEIDRRREMAKKGISPAGPVEAEVRAPGPDAQWVKRSGSIQDMVSQQIAAAQGKGPAVADWKTITTVKCDNGAPAKLIPFEE